ncbi:MAG: hypothetical protein HQM15_10170 [Deltaproteobacteria bacterium]|nr:hypothetical protein [Deltaproteobacteria bacterium]
MADPINRHRPPPPMGWGLNAPLSSQKTSNSVASKFELALNPQEVLKSLGGVLQDQELSFRERKKVFQEVVRKVIQNPTNPYSNLGSKMKEDMVNQISTVLADSPIKAPRFT